MTKPNQTITLKPKESKRIVKRLALLTFTSIRFTLTSASKLPDILSQSAIDVRDAWRETAHPKA